MLGRRGEDPRAARILAGLADTNWTRVMCPPVSTSCATEVALLEALADLAPVSREARLATLSVAREWRGAFTFESERRAAQSALARTVLFASEEEMPLWEDAADGQVLLEAIDSRREALGLR